MSFERYIQARAATSVLIIPYMGFCVRGLLSSLSFSDI